jgi:hypothetical protein
MPATGHRARDVAGHILFNAATDASTMRATALGSPRLST